MYVCYIKDLQDTYYNGFNLCVLSNNSEMIRNGYRLSMELFCILAEKYELCEKQHTRELPLQSHVAASWRHANKRVNVRNYLLEYCWIDIDLTFQTCKRGSPALSRHFLEHDPFYRY